MALPPLELPPIEESRPVAGRLSCVVEKWYCTSRGDCRIMLNSRINRPTWRRESSPIRMAEEHADVAQLVEQLIRNQQVNGSSPFVGSSIYAGLPHC